MKKHNNCSKLLVLYLIRHSKPQETQWTSGSGPPRSIDENAVFICLFTPQISAGTKKFKEKKKKRKTMRQTFADINSWWRHWDLKRNTKESMILFIIVQTLPPAVSPTLAPNYVSLNIFILFCGAKIRDSCPCPLQALFMWPFFPKYAKHMGLFRIFYAVLHRNEIFYMKCFAVTNW